MKAPEVVILGGGMGGLSAAVHCRLHGAEVTVVEKGKIGGKAAGIERDGYRLDPGPSIVILPKIYRAVFERANRSMEDYLQFDRLDPISRVFFADDPPLDLPADRAACSGLVANLDRQDGESFRALLARLDKAAPHIEQSIFSHPYHHALQLLDPHLFAVARGFDPRLTYRQAVDRMFRSPLLRAFFYGFPSYGGQSYNSKGAGSLMIPYYMLESGVYHPKGGVAAIPSAFERLAKELGVRFFLRESVQSLTRAGKRIRIELESHRLEADYVISNIDRLTTERMLGRAVVGRPSYSYFTVHWGLRAETPALSHHNLIIPAEFEQGFNQLYNGRSVPEAPIVYVNATSAIDPDAAPRGHSNLLAVVTVPASEAHLDWKSEGVKLKAAVVKALESVGVDLKPADLDFERIQDPCYFESEHGNYKGALYGLDEKERPFGGLFPLKCSDPEFGNLFYCGGSVQPGAGLPMTTLSGKFAADLMARAARLI